MKLRKSISAEPEGSFGVTDYRNSQGRCHRSKKFQQGWSGGCPEICEFAEESQEVEYVTHPTGTYQSIGAASTETGVDGSAINAAEVTVTASLQV